MSANVVDAKPDSVLADVNIRKTNGLAAFLNNEKLYSVKVSSYCIVTVSVFHILWCAIRSLLYFRYFRNIFAAQKDQREQNIEDQCGISYPLLLTIWVFFLLVQAFHLVSLIWALLRRTEDSWKIVTTSNLYTFCFDIVTFLVITFYNLCGCFPLRYPQIFAVINVVATLTWMFYLYWWFMLASTMTYVVRHHAAMVERYNNKKGSRDVGSADQVITAESKRSNEGFDQSKREKKALNAAPAPLAAVAVAPAPPSATPPPTDNTAKKSQ